MERSADERQPNNAPVMPTPTAEGELVLVEMTPAQMMMAEMTRQRETPNAPPIIVLAEGETWAAWGLRKAQERARALFAAAQTPAAKPHAVLPPMRMPGTDAASSSTDPHDNHDVLASMFIVPSEEVSINVEASLVDQLANVVIPETIHNPVKNASAIKEDTEIEAVVVSPLLPPEVATGDMPEEITLADAEGHDELPLLEEDEVEEQIAATERERRALFLQQAEAQQRLAAEAAEATRVEAILAAAERERLAEIQRQEETARIERARTEALLAQQQALLLQQQRQREQEEARIREAAETAARIHAANRAEAIRLGFL